MRQYLSSGLMNAVRAAGLAGLFAFAVVAPVAGQNIRTENYLGNEVVSGEIIVRFRGAEFAQSQTLVSSDADVAIRRTGQAGAVLLRSRTRDVGALLLAYRARPDVLYAEPNYVWHAHDLPNDQFFGQQYGLVNTGQTLRTPFASASGVAGADISARQAWDISEGSRTIVAGIIDSGVDYNHPDLAPNMWSAPTPFRVTIDGQVINCAEGTHGFNAITRTCDPLDDAGHGTHVAGILGAAGNNGAGVTGVNRIGSMIGGKFLNANGNGTTIDAIAAIDFMIQVKAIFGAAANVRVLNNSWGGGAYSQALLDEIKLAAASDILFVASAGNTATNDDLTPTFPATYDAPNILAVAATDNRDALAVFSSWGPTKVQIGAPGVNVFSTWPSGAYAYLSGTSMAAPMVTGAAALVLSVCPLSTAGLMTTILNSADPIPALTDRTSTGGRLNVLRALTSCSGNPVSPFSLSVNPGIQTVGLNRSVTATITGTSASGVTLSAFGLPAGVTASFNPPSLPGGTASSTLTLTATASATDGVSTIGISGTSGPRTRSTGMLLTVGSPAVPIQTGRTLTGILSADDVVSADRPGKHADFYSLTLEASTALTIDLKSRYFDTFLYVLSPSGTILFSDDQAGGSNNARISQTLAAGTYLIEATTFADDGFGQYTLSINTPTLSAVSSPFGVQGALATAVTLSGTRFTAPLTVSAGSGITVSNVTVLSSTIALATFRIDSTAPLGPRDLTVTTADGTSNPLSYTVATPITAGQRMPGSLADTDHPSRSLLYRYSDIYQLSLTTRTAVTIDLKTTAFDAYLILLSSTGAVTAADDDSGGGNDSRIVATLDPGLYFIEATSFPSFVTGNYSLSINLPVLATVAPVYVGQGSTVGATLTGNRFAAPMTIAAGAGITVSGVNVPNTTTATATFSVASNAPIGPHDVTATTPAGVSSTATVRVLPPIPPITLGQAINGTLSSTDPLTGLPVGFASAGSFADVYQLGPLTSSAVVTITAQSAAFDVVLGLWSPGGLIGYSNDTGTGGSTNARLTGFLSAGAVYFLEVSSQFSGNTGAYSLLVSPLALSSVSPNVGAQGSTVTATLFGNRLVPTMTVDAGAGITTTVVSVSGGTTANVTFAIAVGTALGPRNVTVTTAEGTTNALTFTVIPAAASMPAIAVGETASGTLAITDQPSPTRSGQYADFYTLTVAATTPVAIEMKSTAVNAFLVLTSPAGQVVASDDNSAGGTNARIGTTLTAGTYIIQATTLIAGIGDYTLSVALAPPAITAITPAFGSPGRTVNLTLTGQFFLPPMTIDPGPGITVSNVVLVNASTALATLAIASDASLGDRPITATTPFGTGPAVPFSVVAASTLNFPRAFTPAEMVTTGLAIVNPGALDAAVTFTMYNSSGQLIGSSNQTVPARNQLSKLGSELFPGVTQSGWIQATSSTPALQALWIGGDFRTVMDGADAGPIAREMIFPLVTGTTEINVANPGSGSNIVTLRLYGAAGTEVANPVTASIPSNGVLKTSVSSIFPLVTATPMYVRVTGSRNLSGTAVTTNFPLSPSWTVLNGMDTARLSTDLNFPQVVSGALEGNPPWSSTIGINSLSTTATAIVTITFNPVTGTPQAVSRVLPPGGALRESIDTMFNFGGTYQEGWIRVTGAVPVNGFIAYGIAGSAGATTVAGQTTPRTSMMFDHVANGPLWSTGLALLNNTPTDANVEVFVMRRTGALVGSAAFTIPRGTRVARQLSEWIPASTADDGYVFVRSNNNVGLHAIQLFYSRDNRVIANVPAAAIDPAVTFTPPAGVQP